MLKERAEKSLKTKLMFKLSTAEHPQGWKLTKVSNFLNCRAAAEQQTESAAAHW